MNIRCSFLLAAGLGLQIFSSPAAVLYVSQGSTNPISPYADWTTAATNIQDAVDASTDGDQIVVSNGVYQTGGKSLGGPSTNRVAIDKAVTVQSVNGAAVTVIKGFQVPGTTNGPGAIRCVYMTSNATLIGFTLTNGGTFNADRGGGVLCQDSSSVVSNCVLTGNSGYYYGGGAVYGTLNNCVLTMNTATLQANARGGGASMATLNNCIISSNSASFGGGADSCTLNYCTVTGNLAVNGGGGSSCAFNNCLITGNGRTNYTSGGGAYLSTLTNCTVVGNSGGLGAADGCTLNNCIIYYNTNGIYADCYQCNLTNCCTTIGNGNNSVHNNTITNAPGFVDLAGGNFRLQIGSPCIDAGLNAVAPAGTDLDGNPRIAGSAVDIGAYESQFQGTVHYVSLLSTNPVAPYTELEHGGDEYPGRSQRCVDR